MLYFPKNTNKRPPASCQISRKQNFCPLITAACKKYIIKKKKARFHLPSKTLHYVGASMYWEHRSEVVTRWNLEHAKGQPKEVKPSGELTGET